MMDSCLYQSKKAKTPTKHFDLFYFFISISYQNIYGGSEYII